MMRDTGNLLGLVLVYGDHGSLRVGACQAWIHVTFGMGVFSQRGQRIPLSVSLYCACQGLCHVHGSGTRQFARGSQSFAGWSHVTLSFGCDDSMPLFLWHHVRGSSSLACFDLVCVFVFASVARPSPVISLEARARAWPVGLVCSTLFGSPLCHGESS